jgi:hypothetical protein
MSKMGLHDPFGFLKHKLWPKERLGVRLTISLLTIKCWESHLFIYFVGGVTHTIGKLLTKATTLL